MPSAVLIDSREYVVFESANGVVVQPKIGALRKRGWLLVVKGATVGFIGWWLRTLGLPHAGALVSIAGYFVIFIGLFVCSGLYTVRWHASLNNVEREQTCGPIKQVKRALGTTLELQYWSSTPNGNLFITNNPGSFYFEFKVAVSKEIVELQRLAELLSQVTGYPVVATERTSAGDGGGHGST